ncbi:uncharacterized protein [Arachis hypogaea]|uniref:uncharacterized protein n=1 Tax=Arachis hypogaea TaxID=3818 RepID=UPI000DEC3ED7|nr:uncharacterized protein LOC112742287 [Arachis hypogaea]
MVKLKEKNRGSSLRKKDLNKVICYNCKEAGHFKSNCPKLKKEDKSKKGKMKGLMDYWEDLENDSDEDEESETKSQTCFMADHVEQVVFHNPDTEDIHLMIDHLSEKIKCFLSENQDLESQIAILKAENGFLKDKLREAETVVDLVEENKQLKAELKSCEHHHSVTANVNYFEENEWLHKEIKRLKEDLANFAQSSENLNQLLASQKPLYDKAGLGFRKTAKFVEKLSCTNMASSSNNIRMIGNKVCLASKRKDNMWYMDSGCSRHITGKATFFIKLDEYDGGFVTVGDNGKGKIVAIDKVENLGKFNPKSYEGLFVGYSTTSKVFQIYLKEHRTIEESIHVSFCDSNSIPSAVIEDDAGCNTENEGDISVLSLDQAREPRTEQSTETHQGRTIPQRPQEWKFLKGYPHDFIIGDPSQGVTTRSSSKKQVEQSNVAFLSQLEPLNVKQALEDPSWVKAMEEELAQFEKNEVWKLVPNPNGKKVAGRQIWAGDDQAMKQGETEPWCPLT